jgi:hypothetical protein
MCWDSFATLNFRGHQLRSDNSYDNDRDSTGSPELASNIQELFWAKSLGVLARPLKLPPEIVNIQQ